MSAEPARWLQVLRSGHVCLLTKVFFLNVLLATGDILTDIIVSSEFFGRGDFYWGFCTTLVIMAPILAKKLIQISKIIRSLSNKNWTLAKMQLKSFIHVIGQQHPIGNLRCFFGLLFMDANLPQNSGLIARMDNQLLVSGFFQTFLESAPQLILQCSIISRTGYFTYFQCLSILTSIFMVILFSTRLFFYQRIERFQELNPPLKKMFLVLPAITLQNLGFLLSLIFVATYLKGYVILCVLLIISVNYLWLKSYYKCKPIPLDKSLYKQKKDDPAYNESYDEAETEKNEKFWTAVLTSWIAPCTVWVNNLKFKSHFLIVSSAASVSSHFLCIIFIYLRLHLGPELDIKESTVTHCFKSKENRTVLLFDETSTEIQLYQSNLTRVRLCSEGENPNDRFMFFVGPIIFGLLSLSFLSSIFLFAMGNHLSMYKFSKLVFSKMPVIQTSLIHDFLRNYSDLTPALRTELSEIFSFSITFEKKVLRQQDRFGETSLHLAFAGNLHEQLYQMLCAGADFDIRDRTGKTVREMLEEKYKTLKDPTLAKILLKLDVKDIQKTYPSIWKKSNPLLKSVRNDQLTLMTSLQAIGGQIGAVDHHDSSCYCILLNNIERGNIDLEKFNFWVKHWVVKGHDDFGQTSLHLAAQKGLKRCVEVLVSHGSDVNAHSREDGSTALHVAALNGNEDCLQILIQNKADVNARNFSGYTPLHDAVDAGNVSVAEILISNGADLSLGNRNGSTPLHLAALWGNVDCVRFLIAKGSEVNSRNKFANTPLHEAAWLVPSQMSSEEKLQCCKMLLESGADLTAINLKKNTPLDYPLLIEVKSKYPELFDRIAE